MRWLLPLFLLFGCYPNKPDLPLIDELPIAASGACRATQRDVRVACVVDGDTIGLRDCDEAIGERVRLLGVDAPEIAHEDNPADCWGPEAADGLSRMINLEKVDLSYDVLCTDPFGRTLAYVTLPDENRNDLLDDLDGVSGDDLQDELDLEEQDGLLINEWLLLAGHARYFVPENQDDIRLSARLQNAEALARSHGLGLWGACEDPGA